MEKYFTDDYLQEERVCYDAAEQEMLRQMQMQIQIQAQREAISMCDPWSNLSTYCCDTCRFYVPKDTKLGRCRRNAPTMDGYPVVYPHDWCGDHKMGTNPSKQKGGK